MITPGDASDAAPSEDAATLPCVEAVAIHSVYPGPLHAVSGGTQRVLLRLREDRRRCEGTYTITLDRPEVARAPATLTIPRGAGSAEFAIDAVSPGSATVTVTQREPPGETPPRATLTLTVHPREIPACPMETPEINGPLRAGQPVRGAAGSALEGASAGLSPFATEITPLPVSIACAADGDSPLPEGYVALGPAVRFGPEATRLLREMELTVPANAGLVPSLFHQHVELLWTPPGVGRRAPRIVPLANVRFGAGGRSVAFSSMRLGTYRAVLRRGLGTERVRRRMVFRAITGISMGGVGSSLLGTRHPARFDAIAPLGGPADSGFSGYALRSWVFGGFCTEAERATLGDARCATTSEERVPRANDLSVDVQDFERFYSPPGMGTGGTFDRRARFTGFKDITRMFGNPITWADPANGILPWGVPPGELLRTDAERCRAPVTLGGASDPRGRYYDDEYNPEGRFPVITFCDGNAQPGRPGLWAGGQGTLPVEIALAVDRNANGLRDPGEPVLRNVGEPYRDVGVDGLPSAMEPGYDPRTNPDPAGDDYDRQFNPSGLEANFLYDPGEPWDDLGVDGVRCPAGAPCPYDHGEGNGRYDGLESSEMRDSRNPRRLFAQLPPAERERLSFWVDGGVRDALQFGVNANHFAAGLAEGGRGLHLYNGFNALGYGREPDRRSDALYAPEDIDWTRVPQHALVRYGFQDASPEAVLEGDGAHVGTISQIANRLTTAFSWLSGRWPGLDRTITPALATPDNAGRCATGYVCTFDFRSERAGRTGPVTVYLPPGYHRPENRDRRYPVVYVLHGYGMQPQELAGLGVIVGQRMVDPMLADWQRVGKFIMVFPDGRCRTGDACIEGSFFTDSPNPGGTRMEQFFLDLYDHVDRSYRTLAPSELELER